jgi:hypothetical protein
MQAFSHFLGMGMGMMGMMTPEMMQLQMTTQMMQMMTQVRGPALLFICYYPITPWTTLADVYTEFGVCRNDDE